MATKTRFWCQKCRSVRPFVLGGRPRCSCGRPYVRLTKRTKLWKVLNRDGTSTKQYSAYPLPWRRPGAKWRPGAWVKVTGRLSICSWGLHATLQPSVWLTLPGQAVYLVECEGIQAWVGDKCVCRRMRLLRPVTAKEADAYFDRSARLSVRKALREARDRLTRSGR